MTDPGPVPDEAGAMLSRLVGDVDDFLHRHLGQRPHLHRGSQRDTASRPQRPLLGLDDVDELLTARSLRAPAFRLVRDGTPLERGTYTRTGRVGGVTVHDLPDPGRVLDHVHAGATLVLQGLHRYWPPLTRLCRALEETLTYPAQANAYLTPAGSRGLDVHHDTHDVFALQLHGRKHWVVHEPAVTAPLASQPWRADEHEPGVLVFDTDLEAGDCLYLPRGTPHAAETRDTPSLHLTVGVRPPTWIDVLQEAIGEAGDEPAFRQSLPPGYANEREDFAAAVAERLEQAATWLRGRDARALAGRVADRFRDRQAPRLEGRLRHVLEIDAVTEHTPVVCPAEVVVRIRQTEDRIELSLPDRTVALPGGLAAEVETLLSGAVVRAADLPGALDAAGRRVLVRRLVREGMLLPVESADADVTARADADVSVAPERMTPADV